MARRDRTRMLQSALGPRAQRPRAVISAQPVSRMPAGANSTLCEPPGETTSTALAAPPNAAAAAAAVIGITVPASSLLRSSALLLAVGIAGQRQTALPEQPGCSERNGAPSAGAGRTGPPPLAAGRCAFQSYVLLFKA